MVYCRGLVYQAHLLKYIYYLQVMGVRFIKHVYYIRYAIYVL